MFAGGRSSCTKVNTEGLPSCRIDVWTIKIPQESASVSFVRTVKCRPAWMPAHAIQINQMDLITIINQKIRCLHVAVSDSMPLEHHPEG